MCILEINTIQRHSEKIIIIVQIICGHLKMIEPDIMAVNVNTCGPTMTEITENTRILNKYRTSLRALGRLSAQAEICHKFSGDWIF